MSDPLPTILRRLALWTVICCVSAAPSFAFAAEAFDRRAMVLGVALFILAYTALTSTAAFGRFHDRPFVRRTLYIGYGVRMAVSLALPIGMGADLMPGIISVNVVKASGLDEHGFYGTFLTTLVQGTLLNVVLALFMGLVYSIQWLTMEPPPPRVRRGFDVLLPGTSVAAAARDELDPPARG